MTKVLITAGPTQEPIDDVRFITNASSGKMGAALAEEARERGYDVTLVHGPVGIGLPDVKRVEVRTAREMVDAVMGELKHKHSIMISSAAISDYAPQKVCGKIKSGKCISLELEPTPKLLDEARRVHPYLFMVGFKAEHGMRRDELKVVAKEFLKKKKLDLVVANDVEKDPFGADETDVLLVNRDAAKEMGTCSKRDVAKHIWDEIELMRMNPNVYPS
mgnify:CR=1 FL=1